MYSQSKSRIGTTILIDENFNIQDRLKELRVWEKEWREIDRLLEMRLYSLDPNKKIDIQKGSQISVHRRRMWLNLVKKPLEISEETLKKIGYSNLRRNYAYQFAQLSQDSKKQWLQNFLFIMTPSLRVLSDKIENIRSYRSLGQQRNFLLGGHSGMGKTTCLDWFTFHNLQTVEQEYNHVPVIKIDAPVSNKSAKPLFQRIILECGMNYLQGDNEEDLLMKIALYFQLCDVEVVVIDEIEHLVRYELKRRVLEISNMTRGVPIICASCQPQKWTYDDVEIEGRWNDYLELVPYKGDRLKALLTFIELLLPFDQPSYLAHYEVNSRNKKNPEVLIGPAKLIEQWTGGILRDIMIIIADASMRAIARNKPCLTIPLLEEAWKNIKDRPIQSFLDLLNKKLQDYSN